MSSSTRYLVIASTLVTVVGIGTGLIAFYTGLPSTIRAGRAAPAELRYVPRDAAVVAYADVHQVMASNLHHKLQQAIPARETESREFTARTGINIEKDVDSVVAFMEPPAAGDGPGVGMALVTGRFDRQKIERSLTEHDATARDYHGKRILVAANASKGSEFGVALLKPGLLAAGSPVAIQRAIDLERGGDNVTKNDDVMRLLKTVDHANAWALGRFDRVRAAAQLPEAVNQLPPITWFAVSGQVADGVTGLVRAETRDEQSANSLRDVVRGFVALARLQSGSAPEIQTALQSLELGGTGNTVSLAFSVPPRAFDMIGAAAGGRANIAPPHR